jgi:hypothetical protein
MTDNPKRPWGHRDADTEWNSTPSPEWEQRRPFASGKYFTPEQRDEIQRKMGHLVIEVEDEELL